MQRIFLDSCVWIDYIWQTQFSKNNKKESVSTKLVNKIKGGNNFEIVLTPFLISEISSHFRDWFMLNKAIQEGFSYREFNREKKNYKLLKSEKEKIDDIFIKLASDIPNLNSLPLKGLKKDDIRQILELETAHYFDFYDAIHIYSAVFNKCHYFITKDSPIRSRASKLDNHHPFKKIDCIPPKSFLEIIEKS